MDKVKEETKCEFYDNYECNAYYDIYPEPEDCQKDLCRTHKDCYYRQLKRLEQENEKLKSNIYPQTNYTTQQFYTKEEYEKLQAENERLKEENKELSESIKRLKNMAKAAALGREKYKQALHEIREIAKKMYNTNDEDTERELHIELQDKINSVIGVDNV